MNLARPCHTLVLMATAALLTPQDGIAGDKRYDGLNYEPTRPITETEVRTRVSNFAVETADGKHRFGIRGRLMMDAAYVQDPINTPNNDLGDNVANYGTIIRRARLGALGIIANDWEWQLEVDFRDSQRDGPRFANAYLAYLFDNSRLAFGHFKEPFSLESSTSSRRISFIERAAPVDAYRPSRQLGVLYETLVPDYYIGMGFFGGDGVDRNRNRTEGYALAGRGSFSPVRNESDDIWSHLGLSANYRKNGYTEPTEGNRNLAPVRMRTRIGTRAVDARMIGEDDMENVEDFTTVALEGAFGVGPWSLQGEYIVQDLNRDEDSVAFTDPDITSMTSKGYYIQGGWFLTGESRNYRTFSGDFGKTRVRNPVSGGGRGAWELLARFAEADSTEHHDPGDRQWLQHWTLGLNWHLEDDIIAKFNAMYVDAERGEDNSFVDWNSAVYAVRLQYEF